MRIASRMRPEGRGNGDLALYSSATNIAATQGTLMVIWDSDPLAIRYKVVVEGVGVFYTQSTETTLAIYIATDGTYAVRVGAIR